MKNPVRGIIIALVISNWAQAQTYDTQWLAQYRRYFAGFDQTPAVAPQALAESLMQAGPYADIVDAGQFNMQIDSSYDTTAGVKVISTGAIYYFENSTHNVYCTARLVDSANLIRPREIVLISGLIATTGHFVRGKYTSGSAFVNFISNNRTKLQMRVMNDGILMIKNLTDADITPTYTPSFYSGYVGVGDKVSYKNEGDLKKDFSYLILDNYGGFGVYLIDKYWDAEKKTKVLFSNSDTYPHYTFRVGTNSIFWTAICPPKMYNWKTSMLKLYAYYGARENANYLPMVNKEQVDVAFQEGHPDILQPYPQNSTFREWNLNRVAANNKTFDSQSYMDILIDGAEPILYANWNLSYRPRSFFLPGDEYSFLRSLIENAKRYPFHPLRVLLYTSPNQFYTGSPYFNPATSGYYKGDTSGDGIYPKGIPWITSMYDRYGSHFIPTGYPDPPGNPEGANRDVYLHSVDTLVYELGSQTPADTLDGVYVDGLYTNNIPQSYLLIRKLRKLLGDNKTIFLHETPRPGNDGYLPQIDSYADFGMFGEGGIKEGRLSSTYLRYFQGTYNISNTVGQLSRNYDWDSYPSNIVSLVDSVNLRLLIFPYYQCNYPSGVLLNSLRYHWNKDTTDFRMLFNQFAASENPIYQKQYIATQGNK